MFSKRSSLFFSTIFLLILLIYLKYNYFQHTLLNYYAGIFLICLISFSAIRFIFIKAPLSLLLLLSLLVNTFLFSLTGVPRSIYFALHKNIYWRFFFQYTFSRSLLSYVALCLGVITFLCYLLQPKDNKTKRTIRKIIFITIGWILAIVCALDNNVKIERYALRSSKLKKELRICQISDLHSTIHKDRQQDLIQKIKNYHPDLIVLTGDIADNIVEFTGTQLLLEGIQGIAPIYYVTGNHELWAKDFFEINQQIQQYGVIYLNNEADRLEINGQTICVVGVGDPESFKKYPDAPSLSTALQQLSPNGDDFTILLSHRPEYADVYAQYNYDLIFCGHAHGGQVIVPFLINGVYAPNQGYFPQYAGGLYELNSTSKMIVSRGLSVSNLPRVLNPPELVFVTVTPE